MKFTYLAQPPRKYTFEMPADMHMDVRDAVKHIANKNAYFDTVILDPPYNWRKAKEKYGNRMIGQYPQLKNELLAILNNKAKIISFGYDTVGMGKNRDCEKIEVCLVCHGGDHHDTLCLVEEYHGGGLNEFV